MSVASQVEYCEHCWCRLCATLVFQHSVFYTALEQWSSRWKDKKPLSNICQHLGKTQRTFTDSYKRCVGTLPLQIARFASGSREFAVGRIVTNDKPRSGRFKNHGSKDYIAHLENQMTSDKRVTIDEVAERLGMSHGTMAKILSHLQTIRVHDGYRACSQTHRNRSVSLCFLQFWPGLLLIQPTSWTYHQERSVEPFVQTGNKEKEPPEQNTPPHKAGVVRKFLLENGIEFLPHPSYSPDLTPTDFWIFSNSRVCYEVRGMAPDKPLVLRFTSGLEIHLKKRLPSASVSDWQRRWQLCVNKTMLRNDRCFI